MPDSPRVLVEYRACHEIVPLGRRRLPSFSNPKAEGSPPEIHEAVKRATVDIHGRTVFRSERRREPANSFPFMIWDPQLEIHIGVSNRNQGGLAS